MIEVFKAINGHEGRYSISNYGRVYSHSRPKVRGGLLSPSTCHGGYYHVTLHKDSGRTSYNVHRLVALHFVDGYGEGLVVNHIDEEKKNNTSTNLEWVSSQYNAEYSNAGNYLITFPCNTEKVVYNLSKFCRENGLNNGHMYRVANGFATKHKGFNVRRL